MATVSLISSDRARAHEYVEALHGKVDTDILTSESTNYEIECSLDRSNGLLITGGPDIDPALYSEIPEISPELPCGNELEHLERTALSHALSKNLPVLAISRGMQILNVLLGGKLIKDIPNHDLSGSNEDKNKLKHQIYISPGTKLAAILGAGGFFRVNSLHNQGIKEPQKAESLLASAYSIEDGIIEGVESTSHGWVIGVQFHPERTVEVPDVFRNLFISFAERAAYN